MLTRRAVTLSSLLFLGPKVALGQVKTSKVSAVGRFGAQTHLGHAAGSTATLDTARSLDLLPSLIRDEVFWNRLEPQLGQYDWTYADAYMGAISRSGAKLILELTFSNALYTPKGDHAFPDTDEARAGFARYGMALLDRYAHPETGLYPGLIVAIEVWNEANGSFGGGYTPRQVAPLLTALTKSVHDAVRAVPAYDDIQILGGACVGVPMGFIGWCFDAGLGDLIDGLAVHPYGSAEKLQTNTAALRQWLDDRGYARIGIWATEFGNLTAAGDLTKLMASCRLSPILHASYYLLQSTPEFSSGLIDAKGSLTEVGKAWRFWLPLLSQATPQGGVSRQPKTYALKFSSPDAGSFVIAWAQWGQSVLKVSGASKVVGPTGEPMAVRDQYVVGADPIAIFGGQVSEEMPYGEVVADAFSDFSTTQGYRGWTYMVLSNGVLADMSVSVVDQNGPIWTITDAPFLKIAADSQHPSIKQSQALASVRRYRFASDQTCRIMGQWARGAGGDGTEVAIAVGGEKIFDSVIRGQMVAFDKTIAVKAGQFADFSCEAAGGTMDFDEVKLFATIYRV